MTQEDFNRLEQKIDTLISILAIFRADYSDELRMQSVAEMNVGCISDEERLARIKERNRLYKKRNNRRS